MQQLADKNDTAALRSFALMMSWAFPLFFSLIIPWLFNAKWQWWPLVVSAVFLSLYAIFPKGIYPLYRAWMFVGGILGWINTRIILGFTFFILLTPIGFFMRLRRKLQYKNYLDKKSSSYFIKREDDMNKEKLENPF